MADFETKLRWLSDRGDPVGAEEMIERIEADLAGDPLVVVSKRREGTLMTKTQQPTRTDRPSRNRGPLWGLAALIAILATAAIYYGLSQGDDEAEVADTTPTPTTVATDAEAGTDLETVQAGVTAFYSGDADRAAELFELADRTDEQIREESAYQAAIGGRLTVNCAESTTPGEFTCNVPYHNAMTDAVNYTDHGDTNPVVVEDGVITQFGFPEHSFMVVGMGTFLAMEGRYDGYESCNFGPFPESCATIQLVNLEAWSDWRGTTEPAAFVESALGAWYGGDCSVARHISGVEADLCSTSDSVNATIEYEAILEANVSVEGCETTFSSSEDLTLSCEVHYSNAMNAAVGKAPSVTVREFGIYRDIGVDLWYEGDYPEDRDLRESFGQFAESGELANEYAAGDCARARTPDCATLIMNNLDDWAAWYEING
ncbi:MAG TPA: hypothetical protein VEB69_03745 [Acidimicrobiia bacterium]|nr:hypothetical protein [Acidimicrobiia bacterium]